MLQTIDATKFEKMIRGQGFKRLINKIIKDAGYDITTWHPSGRIAGMSHPTSGFEVKVDYDGEYHITNWMREYQNPQEANRKLIEALNEVNILKAEIQDNDIAITIRYELLGLDTLHNIYNDLMSKCATFNKAASNQYLKANKSGMKSLRRFAIKLDHEAEAIRTKLKPIATVLGIE